MTIVGNISFDNHASKSSSVTHYKLWTNWLVSKFLVSNFISKLQFKQFRAYSLELIRRLISHGTVFFSHNKLAVQISISGLYTSWIEPKITSSNKKKWNKKLYLTINFFPEKRDQVYSSRGCLLSQLLSQGQVIFCLLTVHMSPAPISSFRQAFFSPKNMQLQPI